MKITVYIPSYNQSQYLGEAIESVLQQTHAPYEVIIVDDASTDDSRSLIESYRSRYPQRVRVILHAQNCGVAVVRNSALQAARGDYVTYVDADDRFFPDKLALEVRRMEQVAQAGLVYSAVRIIDADGRMIDSWGKHAQLPEGDIFEAVFGRRFPRRQLFRSELVNLNAWRQIGFYDPRLPVYEDYEMRIRLTRHLPAAACQQVLSEHRRHPAGLSRRPAADFLQAFSYLREKHQPLLDGLPADRQARLLADLDGWQANLMRRLALEQAASPGNRRDNRRQAWELYQQSQKLAPGPDFRFLAQYLLPDGLIDWLKKLRGRIRQRQSGE
jgi:glycosyltransferase involved in cell wall biosynthesis